MGLGRSAFRSPQRDKNDSHNKQFLIASYLKQRCEEEEELVTSVAPAEAVTVVKTTADTREVRSPPLFVWSGEQFELQYSLTDKRHMKYYRYSIRI